MTDRRYSIIPARAVTDDRIERGDLRVLAYLGTFTDRLGWCFLAQGTIAEALECGRSTVQRALARLVDAGWVQVKAADNTARPHACHAYRVVMDTDDPAIGPSELEVEEQLKDERCPPVGTEVPGQDGQGCPPMTGTGVPTHTWAQKDQEAPAADPSAARESKPIISQQAHDLAEQIARIAGHDPEFLPPKWMSAGPAMRVQMMLDRGWAGAMMLDMARAMMSRKTDGPPRSIIYFEPGFGEAHACQSNPQSLPNAPTGVADGKTHVRSSGNRRGPSHSTLARDFARRASEASGSGGGS